jgi:muramoyltetrapeptide carboxypeptidase
MKEPYMIRPKYLKPGDSVALVALASPPTQEEEFRRAVGVAEDLGLSPVVAPHATRRHRYLAGGDEERIWDLHWAFKNSLIDGIWCIRGGYGSLRLLSLIDWAVLTKHAKIFVGMSDITAIQLAALRVSFPTFSGPMPLMAKGDRLTDFSKKHFWAAVGKPEHDLVITNAPTDPEPVILASGTARGRLVGGNLHTLASLIGTPWEAQLDGAIMVLEEVAEAPYRIDRLLSQLILSGRCNGVRAVALGRFSGCYEHEEDEVIEVLEERLGMLRVPVLYGLAIGHMPDVVTWCQGCEAELDTELGTLRLLERGVQ